MIIRKSIGTTLLVAILLALGALIGAKLEHLRVRALVEGGQVKINGKAVSNLQPCMLGCKTEDDVVREKFTNLLRAK